MTIDVDLSPRLQRGDWRDVAKLLRAPAQAPGAAAALGSAGGSDTATGAGRVLTTVELGAAPLEYYLPSCTCTTSRVTTP